MRLKCTLGLFLDAQEMVPLQVIVEDFHEKLRTAGVPQVEVQTLCWGRFAGSRHEELEPLPVLLTNGRPEAFASEAVSGVLQEQRSQRLRVVLKAQVLIQVQDRVAHQAQETVRSTLESR